MTVKEILLNRIGISVAFLKHLKFIENGIMLAGEKVTVRRVLHTGDVLELATENEKIGSRLTPTDLPLDIVYEDSLLVVPSKSADMPTHPSHNHHGDTLADALAYYYKDSPEPFVFRPINRLDRNTSGLTLIAKNRISAARLAASMREGNIKKQYIAILDGILPNDAGQIETYLRRTGESIIVREVCDENGGGDYALTRYLCLARSDRYTLVLASPETGRTNQLRVHFASLGCAILGDDMYGEVSPLISRHALHAVSLAFPHPTNSETVECFSPPPEDMSSVIQSLFGIDVTQNLLKNMTFN
jgi:23S rRNA pseudouridine1911/1915/1917 synthase